MLNISVMSNLPNIIIDTSKFTLYR